MKLLIILRVVECSAVHLYYRSHRRSEIVVMIAYSDFLQEKVDFMYHNNQTRITFILFQ